MANLIQIKRSTVTDAPTAGGLVTGELAYSLLTSSNSLFVGNASNNAIRIGGGKYLWLHQANVATPGALTSNAVVITNGNSYVTAWKTNNLQVGTDGQTVNIASISITGNSSQLGELAGGSNTELVASYAIKTYVDAVANAAIPTLTSGLIGYGNTSNRLTSSAPFRIDPATTTLAIGNSSVQTQISNTFVITTNITSEGYANIAGNSVIGSTTSQNVVFIAKVASGIVPFASNTYSLGNSSFIWNSGYFDTLSVNTRLDVGNINATSANVSGDLTVGGNLTVSGTVTTINTTNLNVQDPIIKLANGNTTSDLVDIGVYGAFGNATTVQYTGFFRDQSDGGVYKIFTGVVPEPSTTVDTANTGFTLGTFQAFIKTGGAGASGLIANATTIAITANATLNVAITANTLSLSTALPGTSGGTGLASYTAEQILVANSSNGFRALSVGTEGYVLQVASGVVAYGTLDGGTF